MRALKVPLYPYQAEGQHYLPRGGQGTDLRQMGLGKTIQAIGAAEILAAISAYPRCW